MSGYIYFIEGDRDLIKIGYTRDPARRFQAHRSGLRKLLGAVRFAGCVKGTWADEELALSYFRPAIGREIRHRNATAIAAIFPDRAILPLSHFVKPSRESISDPCVMRVVLPWRYRGMAKNAAKARGMTIQGLLARAIERELKESGKAA